MTDKEKFAANLKDWRKHRGLTLEGLANKVGSSKGYMHDLENGKSIPNLIKAIDIANALHTNVYMLSDRGLDYK